MKTDDLSAMIPVISIRALSGRGKGAMVDKLFLESERKDRSFSIFFGRGSFDIRSSLARFAKVSMSCP